jgi:hypothetical protein
MNSTQKASPRDVFLNLLAMVGLYVSAGSLLRLLFVLVNLNFPDALGYSYYGSPEDSVRWPIAMLVVVFPLFLWLTRFLSRDIAEDKAKAEFRIRKWLIYLGLSLAGIMLAGDLIALIYNFLGGELTARFLLKALAVFLVSGTVFGYYRYELRREQGKASRGARSFMWGAVAFVGIIVVMGFMTAGSPFRQRDLRNDELRVSNLQTIQYQIVNYWQAKQKLPAELGNLVDSISGFIPPVDPETGGSYGYEATGYLSFKLCANFKLQASEEVGRSDFYAKPGYSESWDHPGGEYCFERTIDPKLYPPINK